MLWLKYSPSLTAAGRKTKDTLKAFPPGQAESEMPVKVAGKSIQEMAGNRGLRLRERCELELEIKEMIDAIGMVLMAQAAWVKGGERLASH